MEKTAAAIEATIKLGLSITIDGYLMPNGSFRYGLNYISELLGYARNYFLRVTKTPSKKLKALQDKGFTGYIIPVRVPRFGKRGASVAETLNFEDFCILIEYEAETGNPRALALLTASFREFLRDRSLEAFGLPDDNPEQRKADFEAVYHAYLERERLLAEDREDLEALEELGNETLFYDLFDDEIYYFDCPSEDDEAVFFSIHQMSQ